MGKFIAIIVVLALIILALGTVLIISFACGATPTPSVSFGFKTTDAASEYDESITAFEIGKDFYTCINVKINTDKKSSREYKVVVTVPKTKDIEMIKMGGLMPDSMDWDPTKQVTTMTFTVRGSKEAVNEKIMFYGKPIGEGDATMTVHIFDKDGVEINAGYSRTVFFKYELQE